MYQITRNETLNAFDVRQGVAFSGYSFFSILGNGQAGQLQFKKIRTFGTTICVVSLRTLVSAFGACILFHFHIFSLHPFKTRLQKSSCQSFPTQSCPISQIIFSLCVVRSQDISRSLGVEMVPRCASNCRWSCGQRTVSSTLRPPRQSWCSNCIDHLPGGSKGFKRGETFIST